MYISVTRQLLTEVRKPLSFSLRSKRELALILVIFFTIFGATCSADAAPPPTVHVTIDGTVVTKLLDLIDQHDDSDASINSWVDLPGNQELLKIGSAENQLTRDQLKANVKAVIDHTANDTTQPPYSFGRVLMSPIEDYTAMMNELTRRLPVWTKRCEQRDEDYSPDGTNINQTVYLELGGDWDAINRDGAIFINVHFFHDYFKPSWFGLNLLISHETFHAVQNQVFGNPELTGTSDQAFFTALSKIQREGTARLVEVDADEDGYSSGTYGFNYRGIDNETLRDFQILIPQLEPLANSCYPQPDPEQYQNNITAGLNAGGSYYTIGHGIATAIEQYKGRSRLIETVKRGPIDFFTCYEDIAKHNPELPQIPQIALDHINSIQKALKKAKLALPPDPAPIVAVANPTSTKK